MGAEEVSHPRLSMIVFFGLCGIKQKKRFFLGRNSGQNSGWSIPLACRCGVHAEMMVLPPASGALPAPPYPPSRSERNDWTDLVSDDYRNAPRAQRWAGPSSALQMFFRSRPTTERRTKRVVASEWLQGDVYPKIGVGPKVPKGPPRQHNRERLSAYMYVTT